MSLDVAWPCLQFVLVRGHGLSSRSRSGHKQRRGSSVLMLCSLSCRLICLCLQLQAAAANVVEMYIDTDSPFEVSLTAACKRQIFGTLGLFVLALVERSSSDNIREGEATLFNEGSTWFLSA